MAPAMLRPMRCHFLFGGGRGAEWGDGEEEEEVEEEELPAEEAVAERSCVCMRTNSTASSSVLGRPDQHSSAAAMCVGSRSPNRDLKRT